jgi:hypothetical protein
MVSPQVSNLIIILVAMQLSKKIPFDDPQVLLLVRVAYVVSNLVIVGIYLYIQSKISAKKGMLPSPPPVFLAIRSRSRQTTRF